MTYQEILERMGAGYIPVCVLYEEEPHEEEPENEEA